MNDRIPTVVVVGAACALPLLALFFAYSRPGYFTNETYLSGLLVLELLLAAICLYRRVFFPVVIGAFLLAGVDLPVGSVWTSARWLFLGIGAVVGSFIMLKDRVYHFGLFHSIATFLVLTSLISAAVSSYPSVALLKVLSLFLLFLYATTGARIAAAGRQSRFFAGLVLGCEIFVGATALLYFAGIEAMGNPNSLGEVMGVAGVPILLWGVLLGGPPAINRRRWILYLLSLYLTFHSHARAGMIAAFVSSFFMCFALRRYKLILYGMIVLLILIALGAIYRPQALDSLMSATLYKQSGEAAGLFASRESPWNTAMDNIRAHPWFGMGLGTTARGGDANAEQGTFESNTKVTTEHGSSYLAILSGVGVLGALPALILLLLVIGNVLRSWLWMRQSANPLHPAVPLATVMVAALIHATFEDWMFAPGNYICVFFWSLAFILADVVPKTALPSFSWHPRFVPRAVGGAVSGR